jgi:ankyrin repeat protein
MSSLLQVSEHDAADPSHAAILLGETQELAQQLLELSQLDAEAEEVKVRRHESALEYSSECTVMQSLIVDFECIADTLVYLLSVRLRIAYFAGAKCIYVARVLRFCVCPHCPRIYYINAFQVARLAEAVLADDEEFAGSLLDALDKLASPTSTSTSDEPAALAAPLPPAAVMAGLTREAIEREEESEEQKEDKDSKEGKENEKGSPAKKWASTLGNENESAPKDAEPPSSFEAATGFTLLHYAACHGSVKCLDLLCSRYGAQGLSMADPAGRTPLHVAAARGRKNWLTRALALAHEHVVKETSNSGLQASEAELGEESAEAMAKLLANPDQRGLSLLHLACFHGRPLTAEWLVEQGASLKALTYGQQTPQALAKEQGHAGLAADLSRLLNDTKSPKKTTAKK